jgi:hypothetical protein
METNAGARPGEHGRSDGDYSDAAHYTHTGSEIRDNMQTQ